LAGLNPDDASVVVAQAAAATSVATVEVRS
jgi:hypothetical protein